MPIYKIISTKGGCPVFDVPPKHWQDCKKDGGVKILSPTQFITDQQRRWYKGVCLRDLVKWDGQRADGQGETIGWWDKKVKTECNGLMFLKKEVHDFGDGFMIGRLTTKGVGVRNMTNFIEDILSKSMTLGWPVIPPDAELRKH